MHHVFTVLYFLAVIGAAVAVFVAAKVLSRHISDD